MALQNSPWAHIEGQGRHLPPPIPPPRGTQGSSVPCHLQRPLWGPASASGPPRGAASPHLAPLSSPARSAVARAHPTTRHLSHARSADGDCTPLPCHLTGPLPEGLRPYRRPGPALGPRRECQPWPRGEAETWPMDPRIGARGCTCCSGGAGSSAACIRPPACLSPTLVTVPGRGSPGRRVCLRQPASGDAAICKRDPLLARGIFVHTSPVLRYRHQNQSGVIWGAGCPLPHTLRASPQLLPKTAGKAGEAAF